MTFAESEHAKTFNHPEKARLIRFIELMYAKDSILAKTLNLADRKQLAMKKAGIFDLPDSHDFKMLWFNYLSFYVNHNRYTWLRIREQLLAECLLRLTEPTDLTKDGVKVKDDLDKFVERLIDGIEKGYRDVYGEIADMGSQEIKSKIPRSPEQRLKTKTEPLAQSTLQELP